MDVMSHANSARPDSFAEGCSTARGTGCTRDPIVRQQGNACSMLGEEVANPARKHRVNRRCSVTSAPTVSSSGAATAAAASSASSPSSPIPPACHGVAAGEVGSSVPSWSPSAETRNHPGAPDPEPRPSISSRPERSARSRIPVQVAGEAVASSHFVSIASQNALSSLSPSPNLRKHLPPRLTPVQNHAPKRPPRPVSLLTHHC